MSLSNRSNKYNQEQWKSGYYEFVLWRLHYILRIPTVWYTRGNGIGFISMDTHFYVL
jgi:hypothetical protein